MFYIYLAESAPKATQAHADRIIANPETSEPAPALQIIRREVGANGIEMGEARRDVDPVLKGRRI
jgi:hypothetical protein